MKAVRAITGLCLTILMMAGQAGSAPAESAGHITGIGGVFFKARDPKALAAWYRDVLGLPLEAWGGAALRYDGRFAWILDPEGNKIELWEPKRAASP